MALLRARAILRRAGRRGASAAALSYAILTLVGSLTYDHIWQALYFMGCGFVLAEVVLVERARGRTPNALGAPVSLRSLAPVISAVPETVART